MPREPSFRDIIAGLQSAGWSQRQIAQRVGVSAPYVSRLATGERSQPTYQIGCRLVGLAEKHAAPAIRKI